MPSSLRRALILTILSQMSLQARITPGSKDIGAVWFIGDSITQSNADGDTNGSPRKSLYDLLNAAGYTYSFTGSFTDNVDGLPTTGSTAATNLYQYHSGYSGSVIGANSIGRKDMTASVPGFWTSGRLASTKPNVILIMLGTNDVDQNVDLANAPARITTLVNAIYAQRGANDPDPTVMIATIPPNRTNEPADPTNTATFNAALPGIVNGLKAMGRDVHLVDQFTPLNNNFGTLMGGDKLHTNTAGNNSLAQQWFNKIAEIVAIPVVSPITVTGTNASLATDGSPAAGYSTAATFTPDIISTDLIDASQTATLTSAVLDKVPFGSISPGAPGLNNGLGHPTDSSTGVYLPNNFGSGGKMPFTYDVTLNTSQNTLGYEITQIRTFAGWNQNGSKLANQKYELQVSKVGEAGFTSLGTFTYAPFGNDDTRQAAATKMVLTDSSGIIATRVDALRFVFQDHGFNNGNTSVDGTVYQEIDVIGTAVPVPPLPAITVTGTSTGLATDNNPTSGYTVAGTYNADIVANDLINAGQSTLSSASWDKTPFFTSNLVNDGTGHPAATGGGTYLPATLSSAANKMPFAYTAILNTTTNSLGYDLTQIRTFAGWNQNGAQLANQKYEVQVRKVGSADFVSVGTFEYSPFTDSSKQAGATKMVLTPVSGIIATGVNAVRFIVMDHGFKYSGVDGTVMLEFDVIGAATTAGGFANWAGGFGIPVDAANDTDKDGIPALVEYGLGLNPTVSNVLPVLQTTAGSSEITWMKGSTAATDPKIAYRAWVSTNLTDWTPALPANVTETAGSLKLTLPAGTSRHFGRLEIVRTVP